MTRFPSTNSQTQAICVVPARRGSGRLPDKNNQIVGDQSLIGHALDLVKASDCFNDIVVSTDCEVTSRTASSKGVAVQWRPPDMAGGEVPIHSVFEYVVKEHEELVKKRFKYGCLYLPTAIFIPVSWTRAAFDWLVEPHLSAYGKLKHVGHVRGRNDGFPEFYRLTRAGGAYAQFIMLSWEGMVDLDIHVQSDLEIARAIWGLMQDGLVRLPMGHQMIPPQNLSMAATPFRDRGIDPKTGVVESIVSDDQLPSMVEPI